MRWYYHSTTTSRFCHFIIIIIIISIFSFFSFFFVLRIKLLKEQKELINLSSETVLIHCQGSILTIFFVRLIDLFSHLYQRILFKFVFFFLYPVDTIFQTLWEISCFQRFSSALVRVCVCQCVRVCDKSISQIIF